MFLFNLFKHSKNLMRSQFERGLDTLTEYFLDEQGNRIGERSRSLGSDVDIRAVDVIWYDGVPTAETTTEEYSSRYLNSDRRVSKKVGASKRGLEECIERILSDMRETKSSRMTREEGENLAKELGLDSSVFWFNVSLMGLDLESLDYVRHTFSNRGF